MKPLLILSLLCAPFLSTASAQPPMVIVPLQTGKKIPTTVAQGYDKHLRKVAAKSADVTSLDKTSATMNKASVKASCVTDSCAQKLVDVSQARFILFSQVTNEDDIYKLKLILYDGATSKRVATVKSECELCTAGEVQGTIAKAFGSLAKPLAVPAPRKTPTVTVKKEDASQGVQVFVKTKPEGVTVSIGSVEKGKTPLTFRIKPGTYSVELSKTGYKTTKRKIAALERKVTLNVKMKVDPNAKIFATTPTKTPPKVTPTPPKPTEPKKADAPKDSDLVAAPIDAEPVGSAYNGLALGMVLGGAALSAAGAWLVILDGEITCSDGRGRRECPNVYNTKGVGLTAFGLGTAAIGAGAALFIEDFIRTNREKKRLGVSAAPTEGGAFFQLSGEF